MRKSLLVAMLLFAGIALAQNIVAELPVVDIEQYKGFLLSKGNAVYVEIGPTDYEKAGGERLKEQLARDGFWQLAPSEEQAHFIIKYIVNIQGHDHVEFYFLERRNRLTEREMRSFKVSRFGNGWKALFTSENISDNLLAADELFKRIKQIQAKIQSESNYRKDWYKLFYKE